MIPVSVNYVPVVLRSMSEICRAFGVGCEQVRKWVAADAPIVVDRDEKGRDHPIPAELNRLYLWQEARSKESPGSAGILSQFQTGRMDRLMGRPTALA